MVCPLCWAGVLARPQEPVEGERESGPVQEFFLGCVRDGKLVPDGGQEWYGDGESGPGGLPAGASDTGAQV